MIIAKWLWGLRIAYVALATPIREVGQCAGTEGFCDAQNDPRVREDQQRKTSSALDCHGTGCDITGTHCHAECECRHLDNIERLRFQGASFRYPVKQDLVLCTSPDGHGTASTWLFNAVRVLYRQAYEACDSYWIRRLSKQKLLSRLVSGAHVVIKTHEWTPHIKKEEFWDLLPLASHIIYSRREGRKDDPAWMSVATLNISYDNIVATELVGNTETGAVFVLKTIAAHLGIRNLADFDFQAVDRELMSLPVPRGGCNQTTKFWPHHGRRGGRAAPTTQ